MKTVVYSTSSPLSCACDQDVVLCVADSVVTVTGAPFIDAHLDSIAVRYSVDACGCQQAIYYNTFSYGTITYPAEGSVEGEVQQLTDPSYQLVQADIEGVICDLCLLTYINYKTAPT